MSEIKTFRDLIVWQKAIELVILIYRITKTFPEDERFGLVSQIRRASISIPSNIAEGYGRNHTNDYLRFLQIAVGSVYELQTQLIISHNLGYLSKELFKETEEKTREVERILIGLIKKIKQ